MASARRLYLGDPFPRQAQGASITNFTLNEAADQVERIFQAEEADTITTILFRYGVRTGTPPTFIVGLQGVNTSGNPDGTWKGGGTPANATFTPPADVTWNSTIRRITLDNSYTCTRGEELAIVIAYSSGTIDGSNNSSFSSQISDPITGFPYTLENNNGTRTARVFIAPIGYASASKVYLTPYKTVSSFTFNSGSTPDEYAIAFALPAEWAATYKVRGLSAGAGFNTGSTVRMQLYTGTTALQNITKDTDITSGRAGTTQRTNEIFFDEATLETLNFGDTYRVGLAPQDATNLVVGYAEVDQVGDWEGSPGGQLFWLSHRTNDGAWTDVTTQRLMCDLIIDDITEPAGGGGSSLGLNYVIGG